MRENGFIKLDRSIQDWQWWHNATARSLWVYLLINANWKDGYLRDGNVVKRGQVCKSFRTMEIESGLSHTTLNKWLVKFEETGEITIDRGEHYNVITINNYSKYQDNGQTCSISDAPSGTTCSISDAPSGTDRRRKRNKNNKNKNIAHRAYSNNFSIDTPDYYGKEVATHEATEEQKKRIEALRNEMN